MKLHYKIIISVLCLILASVEYANAIPAYSKVVKHRQSDGTMIEIRIVGDEFSNQVLSMDGYSLVGGGDGNYYYAVQAKDGSLVPSSVRVKSAGKLSAEELEILSKIPKGLKSLKMSEAMKLHLQGIEARKAAIANSPLTRSAGMVGNTSVPTGIPTQSATTGELRSLVVLIEYSDTKFSVDSPKESFQNMLMQSGYSENGATGSAYDYYYSNSNGKFSPQFDVIGPYTLPRSAQYYAGTSGTERVMEQIADVCKLIEDDVDFSLYSDNGVIRDIFLFYAGHNYAEGAPNTIWPHRLATSEPLATLDGYKLYAYACTSEKGGSWGDKMAGIGTFCHEFGHVLGWIDLYDTDYSNNGYNNGVGTTSLMCMGSYNNQGRTPPAVTALEKWMVGWATPTLLEKAGDYSIKPIIEGESYLIETETTDEFFLVEYRGAGHDAWDTYLYDNEKGLKGLMVTHIDNTPQFKGLWALNQANAYEARECISVVCASGNALSTEQLLFPGANYVTSLSSLSNSSFKSWGETPMPFSFIKMNVSSSETATFTVTDANSKGEIRVTTAGNAPYTKKIPINLSLTDAPDNISVSWFVDGEKIEETSVIFQTSGTYQIMANVVMENGTTKQIIKYINIK